MKLVTFDAGEGPRIGVWRTDGIVVDLADDPDLPAAMVDFVALGQPGLDAAAQVAARSSGPAVADVRLLAPIRPRNNVMAVGRNYHEHAREFSDSGFDASEKKMIPDHPIIFTKATSSIQMSKVSPGEPMCHCMP